MLLKKTHAALMLGASAAMLGGCETYGMDDDSQMASASADTTVMVGGAAMYPSRNIVENAVNSADHTTPAWSIRFRAQAPSPSSRRPTTLSPSCPPARWTPC